MPDPPATVSIVFEPGGRQLEVLIFALADQRHALCSAQVREILPAMTVVPLPNAPALVEGIIDIRGAIVPVLDIRRRFRVLAKPASHTDHLIVAWAGPRLVALRVDHALELARLDPADVDAAESFVDGADPVAGVAKLPGGLVLIHDLRTFLSPVEAAALDEAQFAGHDKST